MRYCESMRRSEQRQVDDVGDDGNATQCMSESVGGGSKSTDCWRSREQVQRM